MIWRWIRTDKCDTRAIMGVPVRPIERLQSHSKLNNKLLISNSKVLEGKFSCAEIRIEIKLFKRDKTSIEVPGPGGKNELSSSRESDDSSRGRGNVVPQNPTQQNTIVDEFFRPAIITARVMSSPFEKSLNPIIHSYAAREYRIISTDSYPVYSCVHTAQTAFEDVLGL